MTPERLRQIFYYDSEAGVLRRYRGKQKVGVVSSNCYTRVMVEGINYQLHVVVWAVVYGEWPLNEIDHIDGNPMNNRIENLEDVTHAENCKRAARRHRWREPNLNIKAGPLNFFPGM